MLFEILNNFYSEFEVMGAVGVNELAYLLAFVWALFDQTAVRLEKMFHEELVKFCSWTLRRVGVDS
jgi:hypothetical protein